ncbi:MAG: CAAD domain-containing protein [Cyanobacteriota bacterium]|jgi:hypothetical protein|nr:CAAD domain-containing protein [Cyanobacteriota bacterium]
MTDTTTEAKETEALNTSTAASDADSGFDFQQRYADVVGRINQVLDQVDWNQAGRLGKALGVIVAVIVAQILIKGVLDTINLLPVIPGLLELLGLVVVGKWGWDNLTTSEKRNALTTRIQALRQEYLG